MNTSIPSRVMIVTVLVTGTPTFGGSGTSSCTSDRQSWTEVAFETAREQVIENEMRGIAVGLECFGVDQDRYPGPTGGVVPVASIRSELVPKYLSFLPTTDPWGSEYLYWSDGSEYVVISASADKSPDRDYHRIMREPSKDWRSLICLGAVDDPKKTSYSWTVSFVHG